MGIKHFSGLFVMLCIGFGLSILTTIGEHIVYRLILPRIKKKSKMKYWLHTSQVLIQKEPCESHVADQESGQEQGVKGGRSTDDWLAFEVWQQLLEFEEAYPNDGMRSPEETVQINCKACRKYLSCALVTLQLFWTPETTVLSWTG